MKHKGPSDERPEAASTAPGGPPRETPRDEDEKAMVIFEMPTGVYREVRAAFDKLIAAHGLTCRVRFEGHQ